VPWVTHYSASGMVTLPAIVMFGIEIKSSVSRYLFTLFIVTVLAVVAKNLVRSNAGRAWMAIRDMDIAAEIIGIPPLRTKLLAFAVSSFYCGIAGALLAFIFLGSVEPAAFDLDRSFHVLFMIIIGGLGSILGCFLGAAFITLLPLFLNRIPTLLGLPLSTASISNFEFMTFGALIVFFLIVEPHGLARLWQIGKEKLRLWPFPH
jgi:branched-chain amino acid transport system permease protein